MPKLTELQMLARDAKRDLNAELLAAAADVAKGRIGRAQAPNGAGGFSDAEIVKARFASGLSQAQFAGLLALHALAGIGYAAQVRDIRAWAVAAPVLVFMTVVSRARTPR